MECSGTKITRMWALFLTASLVFFEVILRINTQLPLDPMRFVPIVIFSICIGIGVAVFFRPLSHVWGKIVFGCTLFVVTACYFIQICYYGVFRTFATFGVLVGGTQAVTNFFVIIKGSIKENCLFLCALFVPLCLFALYCVLAFVYALFKRKKIAALNEFYNITPRLHDKADTVCVAPLTFYEYEIDAHLRNVICKNHAESRTAHDRCAPRTARMKRRTARMQLRATRSRAPKKARAKRSRRTLCADRRIIRRIMRGMRTALRIIRTSRADRTQQPCSAFAFWCAVFRGYKINELLPILYRVCLRGCMLFTVRVLFLCTVSVTFVTHDGAYAVYRDSMPVTDTVSSLGVVVSFSRDIVRRTYNDFHSLRFTAFVTEKLRENTLFVRVMSLFPNQNALFSGFPSPNEAPRIGFDEFAESKNSPLSGAAPTHDAQKEYAVLPIDFAALQKDDADGTYRELDSYFASLVPDSKNEYTGLFRGKNLIYITAESFSSFAVHPTLTPTLYMLSTTGFVFGNFYTPYWEVSTTDGEYVNLLSLIPKSGTYSLIDSAENALPFSLGNQFRALGYTTKAYHNYIGSYYERNKTHPNLGYDFVSMGEGYRETEQWPDSDYDMICLTIDDYIDAEPFHVYYMTISGHLPYDYYANAMAIKNRALVEDLAYEEAIQAYYACNIELDRALEYLLMRLREKGIAEQTVIVLAADHYPYGLKVAQMNRLAGKNLDVTFDLYRNTLILYNEGQKTVEVSKPCCNMDIVPTLSNLFALPYDSRLFMGHDIFCDTPPFIVFKSKNILTDKMRYRGTSDTAEPVGGEAVNEYDVIRAKRMLREKIRASRLVLEKDYYRRIMMHLDDKGKEDAPAPR